MKRTKLLLITLLVALPLLVGGIVAYAWYGTGKEDMPEVKLTVGNTTVPATGYDWYQPVIFGLAHKHFKSSPSLEAVDVGTVNEATVAVDFPKGYNSVVTLEKDGQVVWRGMGEEWNSYTLSEGGTYIANVVSEKQQEDAYGFGSFNHRFSFTVQIDPVLTPGTERVVQGDVFAVRLDNLAEGMQPTITNPITTTVFVDSGPGSKTAYIPVTHNQEPGEYEVTVRVEHLEWNIHLRVVEGEFESQQLQIDLSDPVIGEANSAAAYQEYRDVMYPIFAELNEERYWDGLFLQPVANTEITTTYASRRYTNDADSATPHAGVDYSAPEGTHVQAPNGAKVLFADYLLNTGWTLVLDHGGGLKSYFFHMNELYVEEGDTLRKGDILGEVGSTGYSTGPHLHYEVRILDKSIDPELLYTRESGLMLSEELPEETGENTIEIQP